MNADVLAVWLEGYGVIGHLARLDHGRLAFAYEDEYLGSGGPPLSLCLPLQREEFSDRLTRAYFDNLLPENAQFELIIARERLDRTDVVALLRRFGADCAGAVSCLPVNAPPAKSPGRLSDDYVPIPANELAKIVKSLSEQKRLPADVDDPSPVAGVQSKIALTVRPGLEFCLPVQGSGAPTTHILKVPPRNQGREARLEEAAALLAQAAGLDVSVPRALTIDGVEALLIERFDRRVDNGVVRRIHQEDFAQALGFPSGLKYQRNGAPGSAFDANTIGKLLDRTQDPLQSRLTFLVATIFNLCIGNTDNHAKNHALIYDQGKIPRLAPLYDLQPIRMDNQFTHQLAFNIGRAEFFDRMTREDFLAFTVDLGFSTEDFHTLLQRLITPTIEALEAATPKIRGSLKPFDDLIGRETEELVEKLGLQIPIRERDYFPYRSEPWTVPS